MVGPCFVVLYSLSFLFCNHLDWEESAGCFTLIIFLVSWDFWYSVVLPRGALGWTAVCACLNYIIFI